MQRRHFTARATLVVAAFMAALFAVQTPVLADEPPVGEPTVAEPAAAYVPMKFGDKGFRVRQLQSRLHQLEMHDELINGRFDASTHEGVIAFQASRGWKRRDGVVDERTWNALLARTTEPTPEALSNIFTPGPALLARGAKGKKVRDIQARLKQRARYSGKVTGSYDRRTVKAVKAFQTLQKIPVTGQVDQRTLDRLATVTRAPTKAELFNIVPVGPPLDARCTTGRVLCIDKSSRSLRWVVDGVVVKRYDVRFGSAELPTREGQFAVFSKSRDHVSSLYNTSMPFAMFFSGGQAVHYSPDFAATGYNGASHGCVNVRDRAGIEWLFDQVVIGDRVVVYWS
jgi:peptidoglycan hydrolase-like protein with peptidoglycan-binding domain